MNLHRWTLSFTLMIFCLPAWPKTWEVSLTQVKESATGVVNLYEGRFHPPLQIRGLMVNSINYNRPIPLGSGRHGAFTPERYSLFSENGDLSGQIIRLSLEKFPTLEVTDFHLGAGWTLEPVGEGALQIYSHGNVLIEGLINCSGEAGEEGVLGAGTLVSRGGRGRCGGKSGGDGGALGVHGESGESALPTASTGGTAGFNSVGDGGGGGGGGGGYFGNFSGKARPGASRPGAAGGVGGTSDDSDDEMRFVHLTGGSGGGGGGAHNHNSGGGGGGGGGVVVIHAAGFLHVTASGAIMAEGGLGGKGVEEAGIFSGDGGQGGGGSILLTSLAQVTAPPLDPSMFHRLDGLVSALDEPALIDNGAGGAGRTWMATRAVVADGYNGQPPLPVSYIQGGGKQGEVEYETGSFIYTSQVLPIRWRKAQLDAVEFVGVNDPAQGSLEVKVRGGETPGELGGKAFVLLEDVGEIENLKYFQFELTLTNSHGLTPLSIQGLRFHFKLGDIKEYHYVGQCSQMAPPGTPGGFWWLLLMALPLGLVLLWSQVAPAQPR